MQGIRGNIDGSKEEKRSDSQLHKMIRNSELLHKGYQEGRRFNDDRNSCIESQKCS